jgi:hypothetical protein
MGTGMMSSASTYDPATKSFTEMSSFSCPQEGKIVPRVDYPGSDKYTYEMFAAGKDGKSPYDGNRLYEKK